MNEKYKRLNEIMSKMFGLLMEAKTLVIEIKGEEDELDEHETMIYGRLEQLQNQKAYEEFMSQQEN